MAGRSLDGISNAWDSMDTRARNHVNEKGQGATTLLLAHGYGCDQTMWRRMEPLLEKDYRLALFDYVGYGQSDMAAYDPQRYAALEGYAEDLIDVARSVADGGPLVMVGHSVSAMIGLLADKKIPGLFSAHVMIGPSPAYINQPGYVGGFECSDIAELLETLEGNYLGWASSMAPAIMGAPEQPELAQELTNSFCRTDPDIAVRFARATFLSNNLGDLAGLKAPVLILQSTQDFIAPVCVGEHMSRALPDATLRLIDNHGHCPHLSAPEACVHAINAFLTHRGLSADSSHA